MQKKSTSRGVLSLYHITDRDEGHDDDDDEGGSKSFPSRTAYGAAWSIGEKRAEIVKSRRFLFGLINVPMYGYYDEYTMAQIELISIDSPIIVYKKDKRSKKRPSKKDILEATLKYKLRHKDDAKIGEKKKLDFSKFTLKQ